MRTVDLVWDGDVLAAEIDTERGARSFVHAPGTFVPLLQEEGGEVFACVNDRMGVPKELVDETGKVAWAAAHGAFGAVVEEYSDEEGATRRGRTPSSPFRMLGQIADADVELHVTRFRFFDPEVGRWLSPDPLGLAGGRDLFAFDGSPVIVVDALGLAKGNPHKPASAGSMQREVERGQAPREVERVDPPHVTGQQAHVHYTDGTSSNVDGTTHDAHRGTPDPSKRTRRWLQDHGWTPP